MKNVNRFFLILMLSIFSFCLQAEGVSIEDIEAGNGPYTVTEKTETGIKK